MLKIVCFYLKRNYFEHSLITVVLMRITFILIACTFDRYTRCLTLTIDKKRWRSGIVSLLLDLIMGSIPTSVIVEFP